MGYPIGELTNDVAPIFGVGAALVVGVGGSAVAWGRAAEGLSRIMTLEMLVKRL